MKISTGELEAHTLAEHDVMLKNRNRNLKVTDNATQPPTTILPTPQNQDKKTHSGCIVKQYQYHITESYRSSSLKEHFIVMKHTKELLK